MLLKVQLGVAEWCNLYHILTVLLLAFGIYTLAGNPDKTDRKVRRKQGIIEYMNGNRKPVMTCTQESCIPPA